jgi:hypothetical protein
MIERNADLPDDKRIRFRVGINLGDVIVDDKDLYGDAVNIAARLENLADPGGICISRTVREQIRDRMALPFEDSGEQIVKNIARPIRVYALSADAVATLPKAEVPAALRPAVPRYPRRQIAALALPGVLIIAGGLWWLWLSPKAPSATVATRPLEKAAAPAVSSAVPRLSIVVLPFAQRRQGAAVFRGRRHRGPDDRSVADRGQFCDLTQYGVHVSGQAGRPQADRPRA